MTYKIENNIPVPTKNNSVGRKAPKYPLSRMKVGDSFFSVSDKMIRNRLSAAMASFHKNNPTTRFISRMVEGGVRIWRIK